MEIISIIKILPITATGKLYFKLYYRAQKKGQNGIRRRNKLRWQKWKNRLEKVVDSTTIQQSKLAYLYNQEQTIISFSISNL